MALPKNVKVIARSTVPSLRPVLRIADEEAGALVYYCMGLDGSVSLAAIPAPWLRQPEDPEED